MRSRCRRGAALAWALLILLVTTVACTAIASGLADRARLLRQQSEAAAMTDLASAGRALLRVRLRDPSWTGPETIGLEGGTVTVRRAEGARSQGEIVVRSRLTGREAGFDGRPGP